MEAGITRLGVFEGDKFLGWVTLADLDGSSLLGKKSMLNALLHDAPAEPMEVLCPNCRSGFMERVENKGEVVRCQCPNCGYAL